MADGSEPFDRHGLGGNRPPSALEAKRALAAKLASYRHDPLGFMLWAFPWGVEGTSLEHDAGPDEWQREEASEIGRLLRKAPFKPIRRQKVSGHGIGKSAFVCMLLIWALLTCAKTRGVITANTDAQLKTKTWAELAKWWSLLTLAHPLLADQFRYTATGLHYRAAKPEQEKEWAITATPWSEKNPAAFQGLHNQGRRVLIIFDEASGIADVIWDAAEGATTDKDTEVIFFAPGNPTKNTGRFKENAEGRFRHMWHTEHIDSREVERTNKDQLNAWIDTWGEDSDFARVRVKGQFPRLGTMQLIPSDHVQEARKREPAYIASDPLVAGLDVARYGDDASVLAPRRGRDARSLPWKRWRGLDTMELAGQAALWCQEFRPQALFVDMSGVGAGVFDRLIQLQVPNVIGVDFGRAGWEVDWGQGTRIRTANARAAMWCAMRDWLRFGSIPDENEIEQDMIGTEYTFNTDNAVLLEKKEHMKARGLASPDNGDALGLTFAMPVAPMGLTDPILDAQRIALEQQLQEGFANRGDAGTVGDYDLYRDIR